MVCTFIFDCRLNSDYAYILDYNILDRIGLLVLCASKLVDYALICLLHVFNFCRGYYRCSSSKGCPARKQVEKSRADPNTLVVTYSYDHNHPWPISRNHHQNRHNNVVAAAATSSAPTTAENNNNSTRVVSSTCTTNNKSMQTKIENNHVAFQQNNDEHDQLLPPTDELAWFTSDHQILENNLLFSNLNDLDMEKIFPMREEDDSLFADLEELPECSVVFRRAAGVVAVEECNLPPPTWCGATG